MSGFWYHFNQKHSAPYDFYGPLISILSEQAVALTETRPRSQGDKNKACLAILAIIFIAENLCRPN